MTSKITAKTLLRKHVRCKDRILLINPPVEETRYSWLRWNQPLDLLKIGSFLRSEIGCNVALLDFLKPDAKGQIPEEWLRGEHRERTIGGHRYPMRHFGEPFKHLETWVRDGRTASEKLPTQIWITSLCTFWHSSIAQTCRAAREALPDALVVLIGQYPRLLPDHAAETCAADFVVTAPFAVDQMVSAIDLYIRGKPSFVAVQACSAATVTEIRAAVDREIFDIAFFEEDLLEDGKETLVQIIQATEGLHRHLRYHFLCGIDPAKITPSIARLLAHPQVAQVHFEEAGSVSGLELDAYRKARAYLREAGMEVPGAKPSGFVWIGRPKEQLEQLILKSFQVLDTLGNLILKPFSPTPGSREHKTHEKYLARFLPWQLSPHFFPFSELNAITRDEYHDLYRMAAFLNEKVRDRSFDFLQDMLGAEMLRESLRKEVWKLEPSPLRIVD
jgi:hypothetical protein